MKEVPRQEPTQGRLDLRSPPHTSGPADQIRLLLSVYVIDSRVDCLRDACWRATLTAHPSLSLSILDGRCWLLTGNPRLCCLQPQKLRQGHVYIYPVITVLRERTDATLR